MKLTEITSSSMKCGIGACPAIYKTDRGTYVIIGREVKGHEVENALAGKVGLNERAIEIPKELLEGPLA